MIIRFPGRRLVCLLRILVLSLCSVAMTLHAKPDESPWQKSVVTLEVTHNVYDMLQPWSNHGEEHRKTAVVVGPREVLTTADHMDNSTLIRIQKGGRGRWVKADVIWVDYHANLALLTASDVAFWKDLQPVRLAETVPTKGSVEVLRWREGGLENRKGEVNRVIVKRGKLTIIDQLQMEITCEIKDPGWGEAVASGKNLAGLVVYHTDNLLTVLPSNFIRRVIEARQKKQYRGLGFFDFVWQRTQNPALHRVFGQTNDQGVVVVEGSELSGNGGLLLPRDVILQVDGFDIDSEGDYQDPDYGQLLLENLSTRKHWAGDEVPMKIWRNGAVKDIKYRLARVDYSVELVPQADYDRPPQYWILGGLVFQPLTEPYLRSWGADWARRVPFRLGYYDQQKPTPEHKCIVLLSMVLPDPFNLGYQEFRYLPLKSINGQRIVSFQDIPKALEQPKDGFHIIDFDRGDWLQRIVLDAAMSDAATRRVLQRYSIEKPNVLTRAATP